MAIISAEQEPMELPSADRERFFREVHDSLIATAKIDGSDEPQEVKILPRFNKKLEVPEVHVIVRGGLGKGNGRVHTLNTQANYIPNMVVDNVRRLHGQDWMGKAMVTGIYPEGLVVFPIVDTLPEGVVSAEPAAETVEPSAEEMAEKARLIIDGLPDVDPYIPSEV